MISAGRCFGMERASDFSDLIVWLKKLLDGEGEILGYVKSELLRHNLQRCLHLIKNDYDRMRS